MAKVPNGIETLPKISIAWGGCTNVTDDRQMTDGRTTTYSEHEHDFTFAKTAAGHKPCTQVHNQLMKACPPPQTILYWQKRQQSRSFILHCLNWKKQHEKTAECWYTNPTAYSLLLVSPQTCQTSYILHVTVECKFNAIHFTIHTSLQSIVLILWLLFYSTVIILRLLPNTLSVNPTIKPLCHRLSDHLIKTFILLNG